MEYFKTFLRTTSLFWLSVMTVACLKVMTFTPIFTTIWYPDSVSVHKLEAVQILLFTIICSYSLLSVGYTGALLLNGYGIKLSMKYGLGWPVMGPAMIVNRLIKPSRKIN